MRTARSGITRLVASLAQGGVKGHVREVGRRGIPARTAPLVNAGGGGMAIIARTAPRTRAAVVAVRLSDGVGAVMAGTSFRVG